MKKLVKICLICSLFLFFARPSFADTVNLINGSTVTGDLKRITGEIISIKTKHGLLNLRRVQVVNNIDFVKVGLLWRKYLTGRVLLFDNDFLVLRTSDGMLQIPNYKIRDVIIGYKHQAETSAPELPVDIDSIKDELK